jgi:FAD synthetase
MEFPQLFRKKEYLDLSQKPKKVMIFGTFDVLHDGHFYVMKKAKKYGNLTVVVGRDITVKSLKGKFPKNNEQKRIDNIKKLKIADSVILGSLGDKYKVILDIKPDLICLGYDQKFFTDKLEKVLLDKGLSVEVIRFDCYKNK